VLKVILNAGHKRKRGVGFHCVSVAFGVQVEPGQERPNGITWDQAKGYRAALVDRLKGLFKNVQAFDDELEAIQWCASRWPCEKTRRILEGTRREKAQAQAIKAYRETVQAFPEVPVGTLEGGKVMHLIVRHDPWCPTINEGGDCTCQPDVSQHLQPEFH
jgi:hypothetical protein